MKGKDVRVGSTYRVKVSGILSAVQITQEKTTHDGRTYWEGVNIKTGRKVTIRGAGRLRMCLDMPSARKPEYAARNDSVPAEYLRDEPRDQFSGGGLGFMYDLQ